MKMSTLRSNQILAGALVRKQCVHYTQTTYYWQPATTPMPLPVGWPSVPTNKSEEQHGPPGQNPNLNSNPAAGLWCIKTSEALP